MLKREIQKQLEIYERFITRGPIDWELALTLKASSDRMIAALRDYLGDEITEEDRFEWIKSIEYYVQQILDASLKKHYVETDTVEGTEKFKSWLQQWKS